MIIFVSLVCLVVTATGNVILLSFEFLRVILLLFLDFKILFFHILTFKGTNNYYAVQIVPPKTAKGLKTNPRKKKVIFVIFKRTKGIGRLRVLILLISVEWYMPNLMLDIIACFCRLFLS